MKTYFLLAILLATMHAPAGVLAQGAPPPLDYSGFVKCDGVLARDARGQIIPGEEKRQQKCDFAALLNTVKAGINWMFLISLPIATVALAYGGLLYMSGRPDNKSKANKIFTSIVIGFIIMITAWVIVRTVVGWFVKDAYVTQFLDGK